MAALRYLMVCCLALALLVNLVASEKSSCGRHGDDCDTDAQCCTSLKCHRYARKCQVQITSEDLMKQREKILGKNRAKID